MIQFLSLFGAHSELYDELNERAAAYAKEKEISFRWEPMTPYNKDRAISLLSECDVGLIDVEPYDASVFRKINDRCKLLVRFGVGFDKVNLDDATQCGICIARTAGANASGVAELALTMILAARRQLELNRRVVESGKWVRNVGMELIGKTIGIVGFGAIGQILAKLVRGFDCRILAYDPYPNLEIMQELGVQNCALDDLVKQSDAISIHVPYNASTHHMFDARRIGLMKKDAVIVCTARGNLIDEDALFDTLVNHRIAGAGLDVFSQEPLPTDARLIQLDNIILTPHVASQTVDSLWATYKKAIDIAADFFSGKSLAKADILNPDYVKFAK